MIKIMIGHDDVGDDDGDGDDYDGDDVGEAIKDADLDLEANLHSPLRGLQGTFFQSLFPRKKSALYLNYEFA